MDPANFHKNTIIDTCALWNLLSSNTFYKTTKAVGCTLSCTQFVIYECLYKVRSRLLSREEENLRDLLRKELNLKTVLSYNITIADLETVVSLKNRRNLSKGELSTLVFAKQTHQAFLSDDKKANKLALTILDRKMVQTTSHLFSWLSFNNYLADHEKECIILDLEKHGNKMRQHYEEAYQNALICKIKWRI